MNKFHDVPDSGKPGEARRVDLSGMTDQEVRERFLPEGKRQEDHMREVRSMLVVSLPCPPLPMMGTRPVDGDENTTTGDYCFGNSHDLLSHMLQRKMALSNGEDNERRRAEQEAAVLNLVKRLDAEAERRRTVEGAEGLEVVPPAAECYDAFCTFFREYIRSFGVGPVDGGLPDIRMPPVDSVLHSDAVCKNAREWFKAQDIMYGPIKGHRMDQSVDTVPYADLVRLTALRIVRS